jgi:hypothetical protein
MDVNPKHPGIRDSVNFKIVDKIHREKTFATGNGIKEIARLRRVYGKGRWRKRKGIATVRLQDGTIRTAEVHWYEATGIGRLEYKIKHFVD